FAVDRFAGCIGVDRDRPVAAPLQIGHDPVARPLPSWACTDDRDRVHAFEDVAQVVVGIALVIQGGPQRSCHLGARLASTATMPSPASRANIFVVMTSAA